MRFPRRTLIATAAAGLLATVLADHLFSHRGDDWSRYDHRTVTVAAVPTGDTLQLDDATRIRLLGIADPIPAAAERLTTAVAGRRVTIMLPLVGTRDADGRLLAYVYADDGTCLNVTLVHDGLAYADRRGADVMAGLIDVAESDARRKHRGLWDGLRFEQMPPWRQAWLRGLRKPH